jgi:predicted phosphodiesterase
MDVNEVSVAVIGLNSAWVSGFTRGLDGEVADRGNLLVGEPQVNKVLETNGVEKASVRIALMHHPFSWLKEFDAGIVRRDLRRTCDFILQGHMHEPSFVKETVWENETVRIIPAGSILETKTLRNGYNFVRLHLNSRTGTIWLRRYSKEYDRWVNDIEATGDDGEGRIDFEWP